MTDRSKRRNAELQVIETARALVRRQWQTGGYCGFGYERLLIERIQNLDALGLADPPAPRANACAPVTAHQAAEWMSDKAKSLHARIIRLLYGEWWGGRTTEEIELILDGKHQTVSPRVNELRDAGWLFDSGLKRPTSSGRDAIVWKLSVAARHAINGQGNLL